MKWNKHDWECIYLGTRNDRDYYLYVSDIKELSIISRVGNEQHAYGTCSIDSIRNLVKESKINIHDNTEAGDMVYFADLLRIL